MSLYIAVTTAIFILGFVGALKKRDLIMVAFSLVMIFWGLASLH